DYIERQLDAQARLNAPIEAKENEVKENEDKEQAPGFKKNDAHKPPLALVPASLETEVAKVMHFGAYKAGAEGKGYGLHNWRQGCDYSRYISAAKRHINAFNEGEDLDPESGLSHLAHAACCLAFLIEMQKKHFGKDDRYGK